MHFTWEITVGQIIIGAPVLVILGLMLKLQRMMLNFRIEHEILMRFWADNQKPIAKLEHLPTRQKNWW